MALGPILAAALTDHSARSKTLTIGGVDVILVPGTIANRLGTPIDSIQVSEKGPGAVSTMSFTVEDPGLALTVADGMEIRYWDVTNDLPIFTGWVERWNITPFGGVGRSFDISAVGPESLLDWATLTSDLVLAYTDGVGGMNFMDGIQMLAAAAYGRGPLRAYQDISNIHSTQAFPIASTGAAKNNLLPLTITAGTSLREGIAQLAAAMDLNPVGPYGVTVDMWYGLRFYSLAGGTADATDYMNVVVTDTSASIAAAADMNYETEGSTYRAVYVKGSNAAGSGLIADGTGLPGPVSVVTELSSDSAAEKAAFGVQYLSSYAPKVRGRLTRQTVLASTFKSGATSVHPGSGITITDVQMGMSSYATMIAQIDKQFHGANLETWTFSFGGMPPSGAALIRQATI